MAKSKSQFDSMPSFRITEEELAAASERSTGKIPWDEVDGVRAEYAMPEKTGFTINEYAEHYGISRSAAEHQVSALIARGKLSKAGYCRVRTADGWNRKAMCYVVKDGKRAQLADSAGVSGRGRGR